VYEESCLALCEENITRKENPGEMKLLLKFFLILFFSFTIMSYLLGGSQELVEEL